MDDTHDSAPLERKPTIVYMGKGKKRLALFSIQRYNTVYGHSAYNIEHVPTGALVATGYYYLSLARSVCNELVTQHGDIFSSTDIEYIRTGTPLYVRQYIVSHQFTDTKAAQTIDEWRNSPDYDALQHREHGEPVLVKQEGTDETELWDGDVTLGWVPSRTCKGLSRIDLGSLIKGRPIPGESVPPLAHRKRDSK